MLTWVSVLDVVNVLRDHGQAIHGGGHFKTHHPKITRDDHYRPPLDLLGIKLEEADVVDIQ